MLDERETGGIYTRYARDEETEGTGFNMHIHERCELYYFIEGKASYIVEGNEYTLKRGDLLIMRPGEAHCARIISKGPYERYAVNFPIFIFDGVDPERRLMKPFTDRLLGRDNRYAEPEMEKMFKKMCGAGDDDYGRYLLLYTSILEIMTKIGGEYRNRKPGGKVSSFSEKILAYVNEHICEEMQVGDIADHFYISSSQLGRIFKQATGAPPWEYITAKRLIRAGEMMSGGMSAGEAARECGFGDYSSFYRAYVKRYGRSPRDL